VDELIQLLQELHDDVDYDTHQSLIDDKVFNSFDIVMLLTMISDRFEVQINPEDIKPENFNSAKTIWRLIEELRD